MQRLKTAWAIRRVLTGNIMGTKGLLALGALLLTMGTGALNASPLCTATTLDNYLTPGFACTIDKLEFTFGPGAYNYLPDASPAVPASAVTITPVQIGTKEGFMITGTWTAGGVSFPDLNLNYSVAVAAGNPGIQIVWASLDVYGQVNSDPALIHVGEPVTPNNGSSFTLQGDIVDNIGNLQHVHDESFFTPSTSASINKDAGISSFDVTGSVTMTRMDQLFDTNAAVPEPGAFLLAGGGLLLVVLRRNRKALGRLLAIGALLCMASATTWASPLCTSDTLQFYINNPCEIGDVLFTFDAGSYNYNVTGTGSGPASVSASQITVSPIFGSNFGLQFIRNFVATGTQVITIDINFTATPINGGELTSIFVRDSLSQSGPSTVQGVVTLIPDGVPASPIILTTGTPSQTVTFTPGSGSPEFIAQTIVLSANNGTLGQSPHFSNWTVQFTESNASIPEPLTWLLIGSGLVGIGVARRRVRR